VRRQTINSIIITNGVIYLPFRGQPSTNDTELLKLSPKFKLVTCSAKPWVTDIVFTLRVISMIASNKIMCQEHLYRQTIIDKYRDKIDLLVVVTMKLRIKK
jgi:hypothetical protein